MHKANMKNKPFLLSIFLVILSINLLLAESGSIDFLRSTGKIYSVVAVIAVIFLGIVWYLFRLDKKITKLEKEIYNEEKR
ncbi:CcmD family protein [Saprospiraceae bacterium]|jgi:CcmD family protein|nr:CcmD family protein [Saprospiraceae bacterium]